MTDLDRLFSPKRHLVVIPSISDSLTAVVTLYDFMEVVNLAIKMIIEHDQLMNDHLNDHLEEATKIIEENAQS